MADDVRSSATPGRAAPRPEIILDFDLDDGALFISLHNIGERPAHDVRTELKPPIRGLGGRQLMSELPVFRGIAFFPAGKQIRFLLDSGALYFGRGEPLQVAAHIRYSDDRGNNFDTLIQHDLEIYRSLPCRVR